MPKKFKSKKAPSYLTSALIALAFLVLGTIGGFLLRPHFQPNPDSTPQDPHLAFLDEVHTTIQDNFWQEPSQYDLDQLFFKASQVITGQTNTGQTIAGQTNTDQTNTDQTIVGQAQPQSDLDQDKLFAHLKKTLNQYQSIDKKDQFTLKLAQTVLQNLPPQNRNQLYTQKQQKDLAQQVNNTAQSDHYQTLGVPQDAKPDQINQAYQQKNQQVKDSTASAQEKQAQLQELKTAQQTLADDHNRQNYDQKSINPTTSYSLISPEIAYLQLTKFSPHTYSDIQNAAQKLGQQSDRLNILILDLRDNIGGAIDGLPNFLGPFIGPDRLAYNFLHQGEKEPYRTQTGWLKSLLPYKKVIVLINDQTQSTAEVFSASLKKFNAGVLVGTSTKGWGTIERVFPIENQIKSDEKHALLLVHRLTLDQDNRPIEGNGVSPHVNINSQDWRAQLRSYYSSPQLIQAVADLIGQ